MSEVRLSDFEGLCRNIVSEFYVAGMDRDDLLQEARMGAWQALKAHRQDGGKTLHGFVAMFVRRRLATVLKTSKRQMRAPEQPDLALDAPAITGRDDSLTLAEVIPLHADPFAQVADQEELSALAERIRCLSRIERNTLVLLAGDRTYEEAATVLGVDEKSVDNAMQRARRKLRAVGPPELHAA